jgi:sialate O-acetylesterase
VQGSWRSNRSETIAEVSALAYFFSRELERRLKVPVGILQASVDDSYLFMWISGRALDTTPSLRGATYYQRLSQENYRTDHDIWSGKVMQAEAARKRGDPAPPVPPEPVNTWATSGYYNGMIAPLIPFAIRGTIFYQGEVEAHLTGPYKSLFPGLIRNWRQDWGLGDFPFGYVQLAGFGPRPDEPSDMDGILPQFRDLQSRALLLPNTGMASAVDLGEPTNALPRNKEELGRRLALWADARVYGKSDLVYSGPVFDSMRIEGNKIRIKFRNVGGGLQLTGNKLSGFTIASDFRRFVRAHAVVEGESVVVWSDGYQWPAAVRYAWEENPECSFGNKEGLPALPFRTDSW